MGFNIYGRIEKAKTNKNAVLQEDATISKWVVANANNVHHPKAEIAFEFSDGWLYTTYRTGEGISTPMTGAMTYKLTLSDSLKEEVFAEAYRAHKREYERRKQEKGIKVSKEKTE